MTILDSTPPIATVWISGVTASGKTTLGRALVGELKRKGLKNIVHLDGDELRAKQTREYGYSLSERFELIQKYINLVIEENLRGNCVIISTVSHKSEMRDRARAQIQNFMEVNLLCDLETCCERDYKNIYTKDYSSSDDCLPGVTEPYVISESAELVLDTSKHSLAQCQKILFKSVNSHLATHCKLAL